MDTIGYVGWGIVSAGIAIQQFPQSIEGLNLISGGFFNKEPLVHPHDPVERKLLFELYRMLAWPLPQLPGDHRGITWRSSSLLWNSSCATDECPEIVGRSGSHPITRHIPCRDVPLKSSLQDYVHYYDAVNQRWLINMRGRWIGRYLCEPLDTRGFRENISDHYFTVSRTKVPNT